MAAMMFPVGSHQMVVMYARIEEGKRRKRQPTQAGATGIFVGGYLLTWAAAGLLAYAIFEIGRSCDLGFLAWDSGGPYVAGGDFIAAAIYQLTPLELLAALPEPDDVRAHALAPGPDRRAADGHAGRLVGCCWGLMAALFALGVMSIGWMVLIAALITALEKLLPWKAVANRSVAVLLVALGLAVAFVPDKLPGLTLPDSPAAAQAMDSMGMHDRSSGGGPMDDRKMPSPAGMNGAKNGMPAP